MTLLLACLAAANGHAAEVGAQVFIDNGELNYVGLLSAEANRRAFDLYESARDKPAILAIRSKGGVTDAGIEMGRWVHQRKLTVKVVEYCFSSCANYVFTGATRKVVSNFAVIGYHGGLSSTNFAPDADTEAKIKAMPADQQDAVRSTIEASARRSIASQVVAERDYFSQIGVQQRITTLGQTSGGAAPEHGKSIGWTFSQDDFALLGVNNIEVVNPPWKPRFVNSDTTVTTIKVL